MAGMGDEKFPLMFRIFTVVRVVVVVRGQSGDSLWMALVVAAAKYNGTTPLESTGPPASCCGPILVWQRLCSYTRRGELALLH